MLLVRCGGREWQHALMHTSPHVACTMRSVLLGHRLRVLALEAAVAAAAVISVLPHATLATELIQRHGSDVAMRSC